MGARHSVEVWWWFASNVRCAFDKVPGTLWWRLLVVVLLQAIIGVWFC